jgi:hypothetical protein
LLALRRAQHNRTIRYDIATPLLVQRCLWIVLDKKATSATLNGLLLSWCGGAGEGALFLVVAALAIIVVD